MIIDILFFHCSFVDMFNIISTCQENLCVDIYVHKRCVDHSTTEVPLVPSDIAIVPLSIFQGFLKYVVDSGTFLL